MMEKDKVFPALADGNRRKIIELLHEQDSSLLELSKEFSITFQALSKQIKILEEAGIVNKKKQGKYRILTLNKKALSPSLKWIAYYSNFWNHSFDHLNALINLENKDGADK